MSEAHRRARPRVGITLGDPRGIGPEITLSALADEAIGGAAEYVLFGPAGVIETPHQFESVGDWNGGFEDAGRVAGAAIARATELALEGKLDAIVTAPIDKAALHAGGWNFPGHTEMLQRLAGARDVVMMMAAERTVVGGPLRVVLATTHIALRAVPDALTTDRIVRQSRVTCVGLRRWWGIDQPRLALGALNPHASDGGLFGDEEERILKPALETLLDEGFDATGPIPADTVFLRAIRGEFDAVIAPYHDVGMAPFKTVSFGGGVNVTLGLPFPRTSPDHGTAVDIAGQRIANPSSMIEAIRLAIRFGGHFDTVPGDRLGS